MSPVQIVRLFIVSRMDRGLGDLDPLGAVAQRPLEVSSAHEDLDEAAVDVDAVCGGQNVP